MEGYEEERPAFEAWMSSMWPYRSLERWGYSYKDAKTRDRWIGWCGRAKETIYG